MNRPFQAIQKHSLFGMTSYSVKNARGTPLLMRVGPKGILFFRPDNKSREVAQFSWSECKELTYLEKKFVITVCESDDFCFRLSPLNFVHVFRRSQFQDKQIIPFVVYAESTRIAAQILNLCIGLHKLFIQVTFALFFFVFLLISCINFYFYMFLILVVSLYSSEQFRLTSLHSRHCRRQWASAPMEIQTMREKAIEAAWKEREELKKESVIAKQRALQRAQGRLASLSLCCADIHLVLHVGCIIINSLNHFAEISEEAKQIETPTTSPHKQRPSRRSIGRANFRPSQRSSEVDAPTVIAEQHSSTAFGFAMEEEHDNTLLREIETYNLHGEVLNSGEVCSRSFSV